MGMKQLNLQQNIPDFELPEKYSGDVWNVMEWDYFNNADRRHKTLWRARSSITNRKFNLSSCNNVAVREELKYCFYY